MVPNLPTWHWLQLACLRRCLGRTVSMNSAKLCVYAAHYSHSKRREPAIRYLRCVMRGLLSIRVAGAEEKHRSSQFGFRSW